MLLFIDHALFKYVAYTNIVGTIYHMNKVIKPQGCTNLKLRQLDRMVTRHYDRYVAEAGLKNTQYALLSHVVRLGPIRPSDLARHLQVEASTLTRNMQPLVAQGWLKIGEGDDARSRLVGVTEKGRAKQAEGQYAWQRAQEALNKRLGLDRVIALHNLLDECIECFDGVPDGHLSN